MPTLIRISDYNRYSELRNRPYDWSEKREKAVLTNLKKRMSTAFDDEKDEEKSGRRGRSPPRRKGNPPAKRTGFKLIVENLSTRTSWQDLKDYMRQAGEIMYTNTHHMRSGEGVVEFGQRSDMKWAMAKLDGTKLDGRKIRLIEDCKKSRSRSRGGRGRDQSKEDSRSRSRSRSRRSRSRSRSNRSRS